MVIVFNINWILVKLGFVPIFKVNVKSRTATRSLSPLLENQFVLCHSSFINNFYKFDCAIISNDVVWDVMSSKYEKENIKQYGNASQSLCRIIRLGSFESRVSTFWTSTELGGRVTTTTLLLKSSCNFENVLAGDNDGSSSWVWVVTPYASLSYKRWLSSNDIIISAGCSFSLL